MQSIISAAVSPQTPSRNHLVSAWKSELGQMEVARRGPRKLVVCKGLAEHLVTLILSDGGPCLTTELDISGLIAAYDVCLHMCCIRSW